MSDYEYDVFISYARTDGRDYAERLERDLNAAGYSTWRDIRDINPYQDFSAEIEIAISASRFVVGCITPSLDCNRKSFVHREIIYAEAKEKPIIPLLFPKAIPIILINHLTWISFFSGEIPRQRLSYKRGFEELLARLQRGPVSEGPRPTSDPYHDYLTTLYDDIVFLLNQSVFSLITLHGEGTPDAVKETPRVLPMTFFAGAGVDTPELECKPFEDFHAAFDEYDGQTLLLGDPGAGKTTTLLAFARDQVVARLDDPKLPLPILATIATWDAQQQTPLSTWLAQRNSALKKDNIARLLDAGHALLLLDGLDELGGEREDPETKKRYDPRQRFTKAVAEIPDKNQVVITCRVHDYAEIGTKLALKGAVTLQPLDDDQLRDYLLAMPELWDALYADAELRDVARTPLLLSLFAFAYRDQGAEAAKLRDLRDSPSELRAAIFEQYVEQRYAHEARKLHANLPFTLEEITEVLGRVAMEDVVSWIPTATNVLNRQNSDEILEGERLSLFRKLVVQLHLLAPSIENMNLFIHLLLRDYFAFNYALLHLDDKNKYMRRIATLTLAELRDGRAFKPLIETLNDEDEAVRKNAVFALARLRDGRAFKPLIETLNDEDEAVRRNTISALVNLGDVRAVEPLINILKNNDHASLRSSAAHALGSLGDLRAVDPLVIALQDQHEDVRCLTALTLGGLGDARAVEPLIAALNDEHVKVRRRAAEALGKLGDVRAVKPMVVVLQDEDEDVRRRAAEALGKLGSTCAVEPLIAALQDEDTNVRRNAAQALGKIGDMGAIKSLIAALKDERASVRRHAGEALGKLSESVFEPLIAALQDEDTNVRSSAVWALGELGDMRAVEPLIAVLSDENWHMRRRAAAALGNLGDVRAVKPLIALLSDTAPISFHKGRVCDYAAEALESIGTPEALAAVADWREEQKNTR